MSEDRKLEMLDPEIYLTDSPVPGVVPVFELDYREEAKDHFVKVSEWLKNTGMDKDFEIVLPKPNQILLDYDMPKEKFDHGYAWEQFVTAIVTLREAYNLIESEIDEKWTISKSGNTHCIITVPERIVFQPFEVAAWQAAFGSDPKREALHIKSLVMGSKNPNLLIERKAVASR